MTNSSELDCPDRDTLRECVDCEQRRGGLARVTEAELDTTTAIFGSLHIHSKLPTAVTDLSKLFPVSRHRIRQFFLPATLSRSVVQKINLPPFIYSDVRVRLKCFSKALMALEALAPSRMQLRQLRPCVFSVPLSRCTTREAVFRQAQSTIQLHQDQHRL